MPVQAVHPILKGVSDHLQEKGRHREQTLGLDVIHLPGYELISDPLGLDGEPAQAGGQDLGCGAGGWHGRDTARRRRTCQAEASRIPARGPLAASA